MAEEYYSSFVLNTENVVSAFVLNLNLIKALLFGDKSDKLLLHFYHIWICFDCLTIEKSRAQIEVKFRNVVQALAVEDNWAPKLSVFIQEYEVNIFPILTKLNFVFQDINFLRHLNFLFSKNNCWLCRVNFP